MTTIRGELEAYGEDLADKAEILALNKIDALDEETLAEKVAELTEVSGIKPFLVSGVSGQGVTELLRAAYKQVRIRRGELEAEIDEDEDHIEETPGGWTP
jgi:GTP-binding protein